MYRYVNKFTVSIVRGLELSLLKLRDYLRDIHVKSIIILKWTLKISVRHGMNSSDRG
jgi:hypothetical protein